MKRTGQHRSCCFTVSAIFTILQLIRYIEPWIGLEASWKTIVYTMFMSHLVVSSTNVLCSHLKGLWYYASNSLSRQIIRHKKCQITTDLTFISHAVMSYSRKELVLYCRLYYSEDCIRRDLGQRSEWYYLLHASSAVWGRLHKPQSDVKASQLLKIKI